jgi:DNA-directed RNA polymerase specialized sigma24 family protein
MGPDNPDDQFLECRRGSLLEARRRSLQPADAEDVASDTVISLLRAVADGKQIKNIGGWSGVATTRLILNRHRDSLRDKRG